MLALADIIYVSLLVLCIIVGPFYRKIGDLFVKQWTSTAIGLFVVTVCSGRYVLHPLICTLINAIIITKLPPKKCHLVSFFFSFFYLLVVFRLGHWVGLPIPPTHTNLVMMLLAMKLPGLAFEINAAANAPQDDPEGAKSDALKRITFLDVFHYAFSYMGILTGPYYRYRTYWDSLHRPFSKYADPWPETLYKLKLIPLFIALYFMLNKFFRSNYIPTEEFVQRAYIYKFFYMCPMFAVFRLRLYIGMILAECACQMAGLGGYPTSSNPRQGLGPKDYKSAMELSTKPEKLKDEKYNFVTIYNMDFVGVETCHLIRVAMKAWNTCIQYWMATCVYKRFPHKGLRTFATLTLSALWHGYAPGYYFCICQIPLYLSLEDICMKFYKQSPENSLARRGWECFLWFNKTVCMAYLAVPFQLLSLDEIIHYYKSIYFGGHILVIACHIIIQCAKPYLTARHVESKDKDK